MGNFLRAVIFPSMIGRFGTPWSILWQCLYYLWHRTFWYYKKTDKWFFSYVIIETKYINLQLILMKISKGEFVVSDFAQGLKALTLKNWSFFFFFSFPWSNKFKLINWGGKGSSVKETKCLLNMKWNIFAIFL